MNKSQILQVAEMIKYQNEALTEEELQKDRHTVLYCEEHEWHFILLEIYDGGLASFHDQGGSILTLAPEDINAVYINFGKE